MPLVETLTLLASLGSALQTLRNRDDKPGAKDESSAGLLLSYEYVKTSQEAAVRANDAVEGQLHTLLVVSGAVTTAFVVISAGLVEGLSAASPLLIVALALFGLGALATALLSIAGQPSLITTAEVQAKQATLSEWEFLHEVLTLATVKERLNHRLVATKGLVLHLLYVCFAAQVILLSVWVLDA